MNWPPFQLNKTRMRTIIAPQIEEHDGTCLMSVNMPLLHTPGDQSASGLIDLLVTQRDVLVLWSEPLLCPPSNPAKMGGYSAWHPPIGRMSNLVCLDVYCVAGERADVEMTLRLGKPIPDVLYEPCPPVPARCVSWCDFAVEGASPALISTIREIRLRLTREDTTGVIVTWPRGPAGDPVKHDLDEFPNMKVGVLKNGEGIHVWFPRRVIEDYSGFVGESEP